MPLVIQVSPAKVNIPKYGLEFPFVAPDSKLSEASQTTYSFLKQSVSLQVSISREQREEVLGLLKQYGHALYCLIIPEEIRGSLHKDGGIYIHSKTDEVDSLPWELLHDGRSFCALTQGVLRLSNSSAAPIKSESNATQEKIKISLNSSIPVNWKERKTGAAYSFELSNHFITQVESLLLGSADFFSAIDSKVNGAADTKSIENELKQGPDIFLFSGYSGENYWVLEDGSPGFQKELKLKEYQKQIEESVSKGLRMMILNLSSFLSENHSEAIRHLNLLLDSALPMLISLHGRMGEERFGIYFRTFIFHLIRKENVLIAHRHAINALEAELTLSWDWSWIQLRVNTSFLSSEDLSPLRKFNLLATGKKKKITQGSRTRILDFRKFSGSREVLRNLLLKCSANTGKPGVILMRNLNGQPVELYLRELFRRFSNRESIQVAEYYYNRWGFFEGEERLLDKSQYSESLSSLRSDNMTDFFDNSMNIICDEEKPEYKFLLVYYPPAMIDPSFEKWIGKMQSGGWTIFILANKNIQTGLLYSSIQTDVLTLPDICNAFEDELPEVWEESFSKAPLPYQMRNISLLKLVAQTGKQKLIELSLIEKDQEKLWREIFKTVRSVFNSKRFKIIAGLYLLRVKVRVAELAELLNLEEKELKKELDDLKKLYIVNSDIAGDRVSIAFNLVSLISKYKLISKDFLLSLGEDIMRSFIGMKVQEEKDLATLESGFYYVVRKMFKMGALESALKRNIQRGKKLSKIKTDSHGILKNSLRNSIELTLRMEKSDQLESTIISCMDVFDRFFSYEKAAELYQQLLFSFENSNNWELISDLQVRLAKAFTKLGEIEKAVGLLTATILLNSDRANYSARYDHLITIAMLLIELGELDKVNSLVYHADFDLKLLNNDNMNKLWLIDGHLHYHEERYDYALKSFLNGLANLKEIEANLFMGITHSHLADLYEKNGLTEKSCKANKIAGNIFEKVESWDKAEEVHIKLAKFYFEEGREKIALVHLNWLLDFARKSKEQEKIATIANQLGSVYYKLGDQVKSTELYKIAHEIQQEQTESLVNKEKKRSIYSGWQGN